LAYILFIFINIYLANKLYGVYLSETHA